MKFIVITLSIACFGYQQMYAMEYKRSLEHSANFLDEQQITTSTPNIQEILSKIKQLTTSTEKMAQQLITEPSLLETKINTIDKLHETHNAFSLLIAKELASAKLKIAQQNTTLNQQNDYLCTLWSVRDYLVKLLPLQDLVNVRKTCKGLHKLWDPERILSFNYAKITKLDTLHSLSKGLEILAPQLAKYCPNSIEIIFDAEDQKKISDLPQELSLIKEKVIRVVLQGKKGAHIKLNTKKSLEPLCSLDKMEELVIKECNLMLLPKSQSLQKLIALKKLDIRDNKFLRPTTETILAWKPLDLQDIPNLEEFSLTISIDSIAPEWAWVQEIFCACQKLKIMNIEIQGTTDASIITSLPQSADLKQIKTLTLLAKPDSVQNCLKVTMSK